MSIYQIPSSINITDYPNWDINDEILSSFELLDDYDNRIKEIKLKNNYLRNLPIEAILN